MTRRIFHLALALAIFACVLEAVAASNVYAESAAFAAQQGQEAKSSAGGGSDTRILRAKRRCFYRKNGAVRVCRRRVRPLPRMKPTPTPTRTPRPRPTATPNPTRTPAPTATPTPPDPSSDLGPGASLRGRRPFPDDNPWNQDISGLPVDPNSNALISSIGLDVGLHPDFGTVWQGAPIGIPYVVVTGSQPQVPISFDYASESDPGPYPIPANAPIEGGVNGTGDRHILVIDRDNWLLFEVYSAYPAGGGWNAGSGAVFDLNSNALRPPGWTSADAAGLPIFPGLVRYDEVFEQGEIRHALRFTVARSRRAYVAPATHYASSSTDVNLPPMGMRVRLKANFDISGYPFPVQVVLRALKKYGMFVADNGANWFITGAPDARWNDSELGTIRGVTGRNFEVVKMGTVVTR